MEHTEHLHLRSTDEFGKDTIMEINGLKYIIYRAGYSRCSEKTDHYLDKTRRVLKNLVKPTAKLIEMFGTKKYHKESDRFKVGVEIFINEVKYKVNEVNPFTYYTYYALIKSK